MPYNSARFNMKFMNKYLDQKWRWENFKSFFDLIILKYLVVWFSIVPMIAVIVTQLPEPLVVITSKGAAEIELKLPFHWQILWLSSFFFILAFALYKYYCPSFISTYNSYSDYLKRSHDYRWLAWESFRMWSVVDENAKEKFVKVLTKKNLIVEAGSIHNSFLELPQIEANQTAAYLEHKDTIYRLALPSEEIKENNKAKLEYEQTTLFWEVFGRLSGANNTVRKIILILLIMSLILFIVSLLQHLYTGLVYVCLWVSDLYTSFIS